MKDGPLLETVTDERTRAEFLLMESFLPFWIRVGGRAPSDDELDRGDRSGQAALEIAHRLGDPALASAALDGIGTIAQLRGDFEAMRATAQERLDMGPHLSFAERIDAACMVAWASLLVGDLERGDDVAGSALAVVQPGQGGNWALHLSAWRALIATLRGDWDVALSAANKAHEFWLEMDRVPAGYALRGFLAALSITEARGDDDGTAHWREVVGRIASAFHGTKSRRVQAAMGCDRSARRGEGARGARGEQHGRRHAGACPRIPVRSRLADGRSGTRPPRGTDVPDFPARARPDRPCAGLGQG